MPSEHQTEAEVNDLLRKLLQATKLNRIPWEEGFDDDTFQAVFKGGIVLVRLGRAPDQPRYTAEILAPSSATIVVHRPEHEAGQKLLKEVYEAARQAALRPDQVLEEISREIDACMRVSST
jgi:hypothetical protein